MSQTVTEFDAKAAESGNKATERFKESGKRAGLDVPKERVSLLAREVLEAKKGLLRREVGRNLTIRLTPSLEFVADEIPVNASHLEELIREAKARDAEVARLAENARHAGDADPYRKPEESDDDYDEGFDDVEPRDD